MLEVDELTRYVADLLVIKEKSDDGGPTIYQALLQAKRRLNIPESGDTDEEFPEDALKATAIFAEHIICKLSAEAVESLATLLSLVQNLDENALNNQKTVNKLKEAASMSGLATVHLMHLVKPALSLVDYDHVAERAIEAGRRRARADDAQQPTDGPSDFQG